ncbi:MAG: DUF1592 domain-containing protein, partial [Planctomycetaceae bacterium]|nr:DUF1592 domain-containing protein [Planctomycetaceae bacterium]
MRINPFPAQILLTAFASLVTGMMSFPVRADDVFVLPQHEFFKAQCGDCHTGKEAEAGFRLSDLNGSMEVPGNYDRWVQVLDRVAAGEMPPADSSNVSEGDRQVFVKEISGWLSERREKEFAEYGRVRGRRLSNYQLERSLQDLLGIEVPLQVHFPEETQSKWFSTVAGAQAMSHFQLERHLYVVDLALDSAFEKALRDPKLESRLLDAETLSRSNPKRRCREPELIDNFAVTWCSGLVFYGRIPATTAPEDGWYRFVVRAKSLKQPENSGVWCTVRTGHHVSGSPIQNWVGAFEATPEVQEWTYETWLDKGKMLEIRPGDDTLKRARFDGGQVGTGEGEPQNVPGVAIESIEMTPIFPLTTRKQTRQLLIDDLSIRWDKETKSFTLLSDQPQEDLARLMTRFAERAFRRPVTDEEVKPFLEMAQASYAEDNNLLQAVRIGYRALLCSPRFLYFNEKPGQLDDYEIATRLSYFLWNSIPDEALLAQAAAGKLHQPATLKAELNRMLDQPRARDFVRQLANEWLDLKLIDFTEPDSRLYPGFDVVVQQSMVEETVAFLQEMLHENRSVSEMIDADHTYLNSRLARFYRI